MDFSWFGLASGIVYIRAARSELDTSVTDFGLQLGVLDESLVDDCLLDLVKLIENLFPISDQLWLPIWDSRT